MLERTGRTFRRSLRSATSTWWSGQSAAGGRDVYFGDIYSPTTQEAVGLGKAAVVFVTSQDSDAAKAQALTLHRV
jgi:hypothetical protein